MENVINQFKVLYIEDNIEIANRVLNLYKSIFDTVHYYDNTKESLELVRKKHLEIDLIVVEAQTPTIDGIEFVTQLRKEYGCKSAIIFTISDTTDNIILKSLKLGIVDYLIKPFTQDKHLDVLRKVLQPISDTRQLHKLNQELEIYRIYANKQLLISKTCKNGIINYANDNFCEISQYKKNELIGQPHNIVRHPAIPKQLFSKMWETITSGNVWSGKVQNKAKDGSSYFVEADIFPIKDKDNNIVEFMSFRQDVTQYVILNKKTKDVLKETKLNYSKIYEEAVLKAKIKVSKEFNNLEFSLNLEREKSLRQVKKRALAERKLFDVEKEKKEGMDKLQSKVKFAAESIKKFNTINIKLTSDSKRHSKSLEVQDKKLSMSQQKIIELQNDKDRLQGNIDDRDDVIKHLEQEVNKYKTTLDAG